MFDTLTVSLLVGGLAQAGGESDQPPLREGVPRLRRSLQRLRGQSG
jgi:hypothetical protein